MIGRGINLVGREDSVAGVPSGNRVSTWPTNRERFAPPWATPLYIDLAYFVSGLRDRKKNRVGERTVNSGMIMIATDACDKRKFKFAYHAVPERYTNSSSSIHRKWDNKRSSYMILSWADIRSTLYINELCEVGWYINNNFPDFSINIMSKST